MIGSAEEITENMLDARELLGIDRFFGQFDWGGLPRGLVEESLHRYATEIAPAVRSAAGTLDGRIVRISTTADRLKARNLARDPRAALHVSGQDFWHYAVPEGDVTLSAVASAPGDDACRELLAIHAAFYGTKTRKRSPRI